MRRLGLIWLVLDGPAEHLGPEPALLRGRGCAIDLQEGAARASRRSAALGDVGWRRDGVLDDVRRRRFLYGTEEPRHSHTLRLVRLAIPRRFGPAREVLRIDGRPVIDLTGGVVDDLAVPAGFGREEPREPADLHGDHA